MDIENASTRSWASLIPAGSVSVEQRPDGKPLLRASESLQLRFEELLEKKKNRLGWSEAEGAEYQAICRMDEVLSEANRELGNANS